MKKGLPAKLALTDADDTRYDFRNLVFCYADGTPRQGITSPVGTNLITGTAGMTVNVASFSAIAARDNGAILLSNEGVTAVTIPTAPLSNSRWDLVCARQDDASTTVSAPDADNVAKLYVVSGGSAPSPTPPALPAGSVEVGRVLVAAGNTNTNAMTIVQATQYTCGPGGILPARVVGDLPSGCAQGALAFVFSLGVTFQYYAVYNAATNPQGAKTAGWYPRPGEQVGGWVVATSAQALAAGAQALNGAYPATPDEISGGVTWNQPTGEFTLPYEGEWDVVALIAATPATYENQIWVAGTQVASVIITAGPLAAVVKSSAGDKINHRTFTSGTGTIGIAGGRTQFAVKWRGVRHL